MEMCQGNSVFGYNLTKIWVTVLEDVSKLYCCLRDKFAINTFQCLHIVDSDIQRNNTRRFIFALPLQ
jgi:hypothetical protein